MTELQLNGDALELDGLCVATLAPSVRFECTLRGRLEEALARTGLASGNTNPGSPVSPELRTLMAGVRKAISQLRNNDPEASLRTLIEILGGAVRASSDQA